MTKSFCILVIAVAFAALSYGARGDEPAVDYAKAAEEWRAQAVKGQSGAPYKLGDLYEYGRPGVDRDSPRAYFWYLVATRQLGMETPKDLWDRGNAVRARITPEQRKEVERLAALWQDARLHSDITPDLIQQVDEALARLKTPPFSGRNGPTDAAEQFRIAIIHLDGPARNDEMGIYWLQKAAEQGSARAECTLGRAYMGGVGVRKDQAQAAAWLQKAAEQGYVPAQYYLGSADGIPAETSVGWLRKAAERGYAKAQNRLALSLPEGHDAEAIEWLNKAVDQGDHDAMINLGQMYADGRGVLRDSAKASHLIAQGMIGAGARAKDKSVSCEPPETSH